MDLIQVTCKTNQDLSGLKDRQSADEYAPLRAPPTHVLRVTPWITTGESTIRVPHVVLFSTVNEGVSKSRKIR